MVLACRVWCHLDRRVTVGLKHLPTVNPGYPSSSYHVGISFPSLLSPLSHPFHFSHGPIFSLSTVPDIPPDHTTSQPDMSQRDVEKSSKDRGLWGKICTKFKIFCMRHRRERPLGEPPSVGQSILAILKTSCGPLRPLAPPS